MIPGVRVTFNSKGIESGRCFCPVGGSGHCKHIAALLLTWSTHTDKFVEGQSLEQSLKPFSQDELIGHIKYLLQLEPDMESLFMARLASMKNDQTSADPRQYQRQADLALERSIERERTEADLAEELTVQKAVGDEAAARQNYATAIAVYAGLATSIVTKLGEYQYYDEEGYIDQVVMDCVAGLDDCLRYEHSPAIRRSAVNALLEVYIQDVESLGGIGISDCVPDILKRLTKADKQPVIERLQTIIADRKASWGHEQFLELLRDM